MSYDHWRTGGDSPGITEDQQLEELRERYEEAARDAAVPEPPEDLLEMWDALDALTLSDLA